MLQWGMHYLLPLIWVQQQAMEVGSEVECLICLRKLTPPFCSSDACPHRYHCHCFKSWAAECEGNVPNCPHCRLLMEGWMNRLNPEIPHEPDEYLQISSEDKRFFSELIAGVTAPQDNS